MSHYQKNFLNYKIDRSNNAKNICYNLKDFIENLIEDKNFKFISANLNNIYDIPKHVIEFDLKKKLFLTFQFSKGEFSNKLQLSSIIKDFLNLFSFCLWTFVFSKKLKIKRNIDIIFDDLDNLNHQNFFKKLCSKFNSFIFLINKKTNKKNFFHFNRFSIYNSDLARKNPIGLFSFIFRILIMSYKTKINFIYLLNSLIFKIYKYDKIFSENKADFLFSNKFYASSSIKNYIFKKKGGLISACTQKNILEFTISFFINIDILFSLGEKTTKFIDKLGAEIKNKVPVGCIVLENNYLNAYEKDKLSSLKKIDILHIGMNYAHSYDRSFIDDKHFRDYYRSIYWLKKISIKYPFLNIVIKHHDNQQGDRLEKKILENSNVKIITKSDNVYGTYGYLEKSQLITSFASTMILETISLKLNGVFLDPFKRNTTYFESLGQPDEIRVKSYSEFESLVKKVVIDRKDLNFVNRNLYCKDSSNTSEEIFNILQKYKH
tara:strand:- start:21530 stop:22999 length:1470 start_codon:yes stop_codon:yes gene_type:complete